MTDHAHSIYVFGCYRCELSRDDFDALVAQVAELEAELWRQWEVNHSEHCSNVDTSAEHLTSGHCHWPLPDLLDFPVGQENTP